jgi:putative hydrolase of the HAD superfamily
MNKPLKNILFDMGNVLFSIDYKKTEDAFEALGYNNFSEMYSQFTADDLFEKLETGKITTEEFYKKMISSHTGLIDENQITTAWNSMLLHWRLDSLSFLKTLAKKYKLYLLSNTNDIHLSAVNNLLKQATGKESIDDLFTKAYYSQKINLRKPNADIFEFITKDAGIEPQETLFIDDLENNIETAAYLGFKTHLLLDSETIEGLDYEKF